MPYARLVRERFSRAASAYDLRADLQEDVACLLVDFMERAGLLPGLSVEGPAGRRILDAGCGTGRLMRKIGSERRGLSLFGLDIAMPMLAEAIRRPGLRHGAQGFVNSACESLPFGPSSLGLVVSNLAYQWVKDLERAFSEAARVLAPGGAFAFSTLGPATLHELYASLREADARGERFGFSTFADHDEVRGAIRAARLKVVAMKKETMLRRYDSPMHLLKTLKRTGASARGRVFEKTLSGGTFLRKAMNIYENKFPSEEGGVRATYDVILVAAKKTG